MKQEGKQKIYLEDLTREKYVFPNKNKVQMEQRLKLKYTRGEKNVTDINGGLVISKLDY